MHFDSKITYKSNFDRKNIVSSLSLVVYLSDAPFGTMVKYLEMFFSKQMFNVTDNVGL